MNKRVNVDEIEERLKNNDLYLVDNEWLGVTKKITVKDKDGYRYKGLINNLSRYKPDIASVHNPFTLDNIKLFTKNEANRYNFASEKYEGANQKLKWICPEGHEVKMAWRTFKKGHRCGKCAGKSKKTHDEFEYFVDEETSGEYKLMSTYERSDIYVSIKHKKCGRVYEVLPSNFWKGHRCYECSKKYGRKNINFNPNLTEKERVLRRRVLGDDMVKWRKDVLKKDDFTCKKCGVRGGKLHVHHKDGYHWCKERRVDVDNGATLCKECHNEFHKKYGNKNNTEEQFKTFIQIHEYTYEGEEGFYYV